MAAPVFDASAVSALVSGQVNTLPIAWNHTVGAGANNGCIVIVNDGNNGANGSFTPTGTPTCTVGATSLTYLGHQVQGSGVNLGFVAVWAGLLVPTGSQTVTTSISSPTNTNGNAWGASFTYTGVGAFGALQQAGFSSASPSLAVPSAVGNLVWGMLGMWWNDGFTGFSLTSRQNQPSLPAFIAGDAAGASSVTVSAGATNSRETAVVGLDIQPVGGSSALKIPSLKVTQAINRASRY
jgi:hypothetical protein